MRFRSGLMLTLAAGLVLGGCAAGAAGGDVAGAPGTGNYPPGIRPRETDLSRRAQVLLLQRNYDQALALTQEGLAADSTNARYYIIAGEAQAGKGDFRAADAAYQNAQRIYPAYERDIIPLREQAWAAAFNEGVTAYNAQNMDGAIRAWENANLIYSYRPESSQNLAAIYTQRGDYDQAIAAYRRGLEALSQPVPGGRELTAEERADQAETQATMQESLAEILLFTERYADAERLYREQLARDTGNIAIQSKLASSIASQPGREAEATAMYDRLLAQPGLQLDDYEDIGVALFSAKNYPRAAEAFARVTAARPNSRDAWYNQSNALYAGEQWTALLPVAQKLVTLDPLNEDSWLILARAQREAGQNTQALQSLETIEAMPIKLKDLATRPADGSTTVRGSVIGGTAATGSAIQLRFTFYGANGAELATQTANITAPAKDATAPLSVVLQNPAAVTGYKYELVR